MPAESPSNSSGDPLVATRLTAGQLDLPRRYGEVRPTEAGQVLFREGDRGYDFIVILSGTVTVVDHQAGVERELATGGPGEFVAELNILTGERLFTTAVVAEPGSGACGIPGSPAGADWAGPSAGEQILETALRRRRWLSQVPAGMAASVYGASEGLATVILDGLGVGGQIGSTSRIENYLGFRSA